MALRHESDSLKDSVGFLKKNIFICLIVLIIFVAGVASGYIFFEDRNDPDSVGQFFVEVCYRVIEEKFPQQLERMQEMTTLGRTWLILWNNLKVVFFSMILGIFFGIPSLFIAYLNGMLIGIVGGMSAEQGISMSQFFLGIIPHGIFEIPAFLLAAAIGVRIGLLILPVLHPRRMTLVELLKPVFIHIVMALKITIPLLLIAAIIEVTLTPELVRSIMGGGL
jgi:stage II sporulation protein M